jgi:HlyD family secretion protein
VTDVDETEIVDVAVDQAAEVVVDAVPDRVYHGRVVEVGSSGFNRARQPDVTYFKVEVLLADADEHLRPGMSARVEIATAAHADALVVPVQAVVERPPEKAGEDGATAAAEEEDDEKVVFVVEDGVARRRRVEEGIAETTHVEIRSGLAAGERVVTGPYRTLRDLEDGDAIVVVDPERDKEKQDGDEDEGDEDRDGG